MKENLPAFILLLFFFFNNLKKSLKYWRVRDQVFHLKL